MPPPDLFLLDTNVLIHLIRGDELGAKIDGQYGLRSAFRRSIICVVTVGELYAFAARRNWGPKKQAQLEDILDELVVQDLNHPGVLRAYGEIDLACKKHPIGQNDMWIAAVCRAAKATLLTTDKDFDHLHPSELRRIWIDPATGAAHE